MPPSAHTSANTPRIWSSTKANPRTKTAHVPTTWCAICSPNTTTFAASSSWAAAFPGAARLAGSPEERRRQIKLVCRDIGPETRKGLTEGLITAALCHPMTETSQTLIQTMIDVTTRDTPGPTLQRTIPFEIVTPENI